MPSIFNPALVDLAKLRVKQSFVDAATAGGADPAAAGGAPPAGGDPMAAAGGDPMAAAGGGAPAGPDPMVEIEMLKQQIASMGQGGMGGGMGGAQPLKPKIDVNVEIMQIKKMLARVVDSLGIQIPAAEMTATSTDLTQMAQQQQGAAAGGAPAPSAIPPIQPMQAAMPAAGGEKTSGYNGRLFDPAYAPLSVTSADLPSEAARLAHLLKPSTK